MSPRPREGGFTLLEVLVAFIIAAFATAALLQGGADGLRNTGLAGHSQDAVALARSHLAAFAALGAPAAEDLQGDDGGYQWHLHVAPRDSMPTTGPGRTGGAATLYDVSVTISWSSGGRSRTVQLDTQRLSPAAP